jgi:hypothetical protein
MAADRWRRSSTSASKGPVRFGAFRQDLELGVRGHRLQRRAFSGSLAGP